MEREDNAYLQSLKHAALLEGVDLCGLSIHQGFVDPDELGCGVRPFAVAPQWRSRGRR